MSEEPEQQADDEDVAGPGADDADELGAPEGADDGDDGTTGGSGPGRRRLVIGAALALVLAVVVGFVLVGGGGSGRADDADPDADATTTTRDVPTRVLDPDQAEIATVKPEVTLIEVLADAPAGWHDATEAVRIDDAAVEVGEPGPNAQDELPTIEGPIIGRYAVEDGWEFTNPGPYLPQQPMTFLIIERRDAWAKVLVPVRPNHTEGYIRLDDVTVETTEYRIEVSLSGTTLTAYDGDEVLAETKVVIGTPFSQTPTGLFYVTDIVPYEQPDGVYGPVALATNGYSEWMDEFDTGVPVVALHGTSRPEQVGQQLSNGCIRVPNDVISMLAETMPQGTPVLITP